MRQHWDIFCAVVDNYGDIGVTWRLARQLVAEHQFVVRLWVDDLNALARLCPEASAQAPQQVVQGVDVRQWSANSVADEPSAVVIEAFACHLPASFEAAMADSPRPPLWLNLEYLSAEDWVPGCHGLPSPQANGLRKTFFFPGFVEGTGGLLREAALLTERQRFQQDLTAQAEFLDGLGVPWHESSRRISLFSYENPQLGSWLDVLAADTRPTQLLVPQGRIVADVQRWLGVPAMNCGESFQRGNLHIHLLPFMPQDDFDRLLWCCELNLVRGEDSFVRAQWAGRPLLWHIYQQEEAAHWVKLEAFLALYQQGLDEPAARALHDFFHAWNGQGDMAAAWIALLPHWQAVAEQAKNWCHLQAGRPDLAAKLAQLYRNWLSCVA